MGADWGAIASVASFGTNWDAGDFTLAVVIALAAYVAVCHLFDL